MTGGAARPVVYVLLDYFIDGSSVLGVYATEKRAQAAGESVISERSPECWRSARLVWHDGDLNVCGQTLGIIECEVKD